MDELIGEYKVEIAEPGCAPGSGRYGLRIDLGNDISAVFPYLNAVFSESYYDNENQILILREPDQIYALRPKEVRLASIEDPLKAGQIADNIIGRINRVWRDRHTITPCFTERKQPRVIEILQLLPKTNCKKCGHVTCLAYAADLSAGRARLEDCLPVSEPQYTENKQKLLALLHTTGLTDR